MFMLVLAALAAQPSAPPARQPTTTPSTAQPATPSTAQQPAAPSAAQPANATAQLDGRTFDVQLAQPGKKPDADTLIFKDGKFRSTMCDQYGFTETSYIAAPIEGGGYSFVADATSPTDGLIHWIGTVQGDRVIGMATWTKSGQGSIVYTFAGNAARARAGTR